MSNPVIVPPCGPRSPGWNPEPGTGLRLAALLGAMRRAGGAGPLAQLLLAPYGSLLRAHLLSDLTRGPVAAFAAHGSAGPHTPGSGFFVLWQAAYHRCVVTAMPDGRGPASAL